MKIKKEMRAAYIIVIVVGVVGIGISTFFLNEYYKQQTFETSLDKSEDTSKEEVASSLEEAKLAYEYYAKNFVQDVFLKCDDSFTDSGGKITACYDKLMINRATLIEIWTDCYDNITRNRTFQITDQDLKYCEGLALTTIGFTLYNDYIFSIGSNP